MASRRKIYHLPRRTDLRSQKQRLQALRAAAEVNPAWELLVSSEDESEEETRSVQGAMAGAAAAGAVAASKPGGELLTLLKDFLAVQHRREEKMLAEFQGLRASLTKTE